MISFTTLLKAACVSGALVLLVSGSPVLAKTPAGLDSRPVIGPYMNAHLPDNNDDAMPLLLSDTGVLTNTPAFQPHTGLIPFDVNSPLWSDNAIKSRWIGLPYDGTNTSPVIEFSALGSWLFPAGTVFVKQFNLVTDERVGAVNPVRRLETRILIRNADGGIRGATYRWRLDNSDADIVITATNETITVTAQDDSTHEQTWLYPGPDDCVRCHNANAGLVLGVKTAQLNGDMVYHQLDASPDRTDNHLDAYAEWATNPYDVASVSAVSPTLIHVQFNRVVELSSATAVANYSIKDASNNIVAVGSVTADADPAAVNITVSVLQPDTLYFVTINRVLEQQLPQNPIWPNTKIAFTSLSLDTDGDGLADKVDLDDDGDGVPDYIDAEPLNAGNANERMLPVNGDYKGSTIMDKSVTQ